MKKNKFIQGKEEKQYKENFKSLLRIVNPPQITDEERTRLIEEKRKERGL